MVDVSQPRQTRAGKRWLVTAAAVLAALGLRAALTPLVNDQMPYLLSAIAAMLAAWYGGLAPGLAAAAAGALLVNLFFLHPNLRLGIDNSAQLISLVAYLVLTVVAVLICESL